MNLKERFENHQVQPDPELWNRVSGTMRRQRILRRASWFGVASLALLSTALVWNYVSGRPQAGQTPSEPLVVAEAPAVQTAVTPVAQEPQTEVSAAERPADKAAASLQTESAPMAVSNSQLAVLPLSETPAAAPAVKTVPVAKAPVAKTPVAEPEKPALQTPAKTQPVQPAETRKQESKSSSAKAPVPPASELMISIPNAFAPDDPSSDQVRRFKVVPNNGAEISNFKMYIYNRGGRQVFVSRDINLAWDGTSNGQPQPKGNYVYVIEYKDAQKGLQQTRGSVLLIR